jgi:hypothetical protein
MAKRALTPTELSNLKIANRVPSNSVSIINPDTNTIYWVDPTATDTIRRLQNGGDSNGISGVYLSTNLFVDDNPEPEVQQVSTPTAPVVVQNTAPITVDLKSVIQITPNNKITRDYTKYSMRAVDSQTLMFTNTSNLVDLNVNVRSGFGIIFTPSAFALAKGAQQNVVLSFDPTELEKYQEGVNSLTVVVDVTSPTGIIVPAQPQVQPQSQPVEEQPVSNVGVPAPTWPVMDFEQRTTLDPVIEVSGYFTYSTVRTQVDTIHQNSDGDRFITNTRIEFGQRSIVEDRTPQSTWVSGLQGGLNYGSPPAGWVQDPYGGDWYPPTDPYVINNWYRPVANTPAVDPPQTFINTDPPVVETVPTDVPNLEIPPVNPQPEVPTWTNGNTGETNVGTPPIGYGFSPDNGAWFPRNSPELDTEDNIPTRGRVRPRLAE